MTEELKPCPFCGGQAKMDHRRSDDVFRVRCISCLVTTRAVGSSARAAQCWNTRPNQPLIALPVIDESLLGEGK